MTSKVNLENPATTGNDGIASAVLHCYNNPNKAGEVSHISNAPFPPPFNDEKIHSAIHKETDDDLSAICEAIKEEETNEKMNEEANKENYDGDMTGVRSDVRHASHYYNNTNKAGEINHVITPFTKDEIANYFNNTNKMEEINDISDDASLGSIIYEKTNTISKITDDDNGGMDVTEI